LDVVWGEDAKGVAPLGRGFDARSIPKGPRVRKSIRSGYDRAVRTVSIVAGIALILAGLVWMAQGLNLPFAPRSFMTSDRTWIVIGAAAVLVGGILVWQGRRRRATG
jgi:hypothetical protein